MPFVADDELQYGGGKAGEAASGSALEFRRKVRGWLAVLQKNVVGLLFVFRY